MTFNYYHASDTAPIYSHHLKGYAVDSRRCLADRKQRISDAIHRTYETMRSLKPAELGHLLLVLALPLVAHTFA